MPPQAQQGHRSSPDAVAGIDIITPSTRHDDTVKRMVLRRFRRTMRRLFGGRWKQMSDGEVRELEKQIAADMRQGTFRAVEPELTIRPPPTADELWQRQDDNGAGPGRLPSMASTINKRSTVVSRAARGPHYDEYGDDYGGYQDAHSVAGWGGGGGAGSSDSGYGPGYYDRVPPRKQLPGTAAPRQPEYYVPGGGPFDMPEARPESVYDGGGAGSRANSMRSNFTTRTAASRRPVPPPQGYYYPPNSSAYGEGPGARAYSMRSDPGRIYARNSPMPRMSLRPQPSWDGRYHGGAEGPRSYSYGPGDRGYPYGGGENNNGYRGWDGQDIEEHEYPTQDQYPPQDQYPQQAQGTHYQDHQYPER